MLHTILPIEAMLPQAELPPVEYRDCAYGKLEGRRDEQGRFTVSRILSTDPKAFLDQRYSPGVTL